MIIILFLSARINYLSVVILNIFLSSKTLTPPSPQYFLSVLVFGGIPTLRVCTCCINECVHVSGRINGRDHSGDIYIVKTMCGILVDTVTSTVTQWVRPDAKYLIC